MEERYHMELRLVCREHGFFRPVLAGLHRRDGFFRAVSEMLLKCLAWKMKMWSVRSRTGLSLGVGSIEDWILIISRWREAEVLRRMVHRI